MQKLFQMQHYTSISNEWNNEQNKWNNAHKNHIVINCEFTPLGGEFLIFSKHPLHGYKPIFDHIPTTFG
jgi:hypothetical protein